MDATEAFNRAAKALADAEHCATANAAGAEALVAVADGWTRLAQASVPVVVSERELAERIQQALRRHPGPGRTA